MPNSQTLLTAAPPAALAVGAAFSPVVQVAALLYVSAFVFLVVMCVVGSPTYVRNARWALNLLLVRRIKTPPPPPPTSPPADEPAANGVSHHQ